MPTWNEILDEVIRQQAVDPNALDTIRRKYLAQLHQATGRNIIAYYSGFLERNAGVNSLSVDDNDINYFMRVVQGLDKTLGLDLILHTPGGDVGATEAIVNYLKHCFGNDIRVIVPQIAMSAGTMIACSAKEIIMAKHSSLGPIDPQMGGLPAHGILSEFTRAREEIDANPNSPGTFGTWSSIISKYPPTLITSCEQAIEWAERMVTEWLECNMFHGEENATDKSQAVVSALGDHHQMKAHNRHVHIDQAKSIGLKINQLEDSQALQEAVLSVHHSFMHTFSSSTASKIVENHNGQATVLSS